MDDWPESKKKRLIELIQKIGLPSNGKALDFGCGNGVFSEVLQRALPGWEIFGSDISPTALQNASNRYPGVYFRDFDELLNGGYRFDFIFSHHVLEHVSDLDETVDLLSKLMQDTGYMFHILPCGDPGSFEYEMVQRIQGGINPQIGNRFHYEDIGHLRRLSTEDIGKSFARAGYKIDMAWYANHYWGALEWMSDYPEAFIDEQLIPIEQARDAESKQYLNQVKKLITKVRDARKVAKDGQKHHIKMLLKELASKPLSMVQFPARLLRIINLAQFGKKFSEELKNEWDRKSTEKGGSEMYIVFHK